jgi:hypothetical protein
MSSIYQRALGSDFNRLHPEVQRRFRFSSSDGLASIGTGVMDEIWKGRFYTEPFLRVGTWRRIMFPETGRNIPFTIELCLRRSVRTGDGLVGSNVRIPSHATLRCVHGLQRGPRPGCGLPRPMNTWLSTSSCRLIPMVACDSVRERSDFTRA